MKTTKSLYVVATPIGNLEDITLRAIRVLGSVDLIVSEDTRHSRKLLTHYEISKPIESYHRHNEAKQTARLVKRIKSGENVALICDAGTPAISDPGQRLVAEAHKEGIRVVPIPGASALTSAVSASGISATELLFVSFLPSKPRERQVRLEELAREKRTIVIFEAPHRVQQTLSELVSIFGGERKACVAREMTKIFETIIQADLNELQKWIEERAENTKGEFVIVIEGALERPPDLPLDETLHELLKELSPKKAAAVASKILSMNRNQLYRRVIELKDSNN